MFKRVTEVQFPAPCEANVNMMPIVMGDEGSIPLSLRQYSTLINQCNFRKGSVVYLSVQEGVVFKGYTQRRPGVHTDGTATMGWGLGWGGGAPPPKPTKPKPDPEPKKGIYMASTNGLCRVWDTLSYDVDSHGALEAPDAPSVVTSPNTLYWMTDRTPHESLPQEQDQYRQWFRLVAEEIGVWFAQHSTPNPLGVKPNAPIEFGSKFANV